MNKNSTSLNYQTKTTDILLIVLYTGIYSEEVSFEETT